MGKLVVHSLCRTTSTDHQSLCEEGMARSYCMVSQSVTCIAAFGETIGSRYRSTRVSATGSYQRQLRLAPLASTGFYWLLLAAIGY